jgi:hypothetical protein
MIAPYGNCPPLSTSRDLATARVKVQEGSEAFSAGRAFRLPYEYSIGATPVVLRFTSPVNFNLTLQTLSLDNGNIRLDAYRDATESGTWTDVEAYKRNAVDGDYTRQVTVDTGGTITPIGGSVDIIRLRTSGSTAQRTNVGGALSGKRRLPPGTYYLQLSRIEGNETATGVYLIEWEELDE